MNIIETLFVDEIPSSFRKPNETLKACIGRFLLTNRDLLHSKLKKLAKLNNIIDDNGKLDIKKTQKMIMKNENLKITDDIKIIKKPSKNKQSKEEKKKLLEDKLLQLNIKIVNSESDYKRFLASAELKNNNSAINANRARDVKKLLDEVKKEYEYLKNELSKL